MIRAPSRFRVILWMQVRAWLNGMRRAVSTDPLPVAIGAIMLLSGGIGALMMALLPFSFFLVMPDEPLILFWVVFGLFAFLVLFGAMGSLSSDSGDLADAQRLQVFPIPRRELVTLDLLAGMLNPGAAFFVPSVLATALGAMLFNLRAGRPVSALSGPIAILAAFLGATALIRIFSTVISLSGRRLRELVGIVVVAIFSSLGLVGMVLSDEETMRTLRAGAGIARELLRATPPGAAANLAVGGGGILDALSIAAWTALLLLAHARLTARALDGEGGYHTRVRAGAGRGVRFRALERLLPRPVLGVMIADLRTLFRIPQMWILLIIPAIFALLLGGPMSAMTGGNDAEQFVEWRVPVTSVMMAVFLTSSLLTNLFGTDQAGSAMWILSPAKAWHILMGKGLARMTFGMLQMAVFIAVVAARSGDLSAADYARSWLTWGATSLWVLAPGNLLSIRVPFRMSHGMKHERSARGGFALVGQLVALIAVMPPALMILGGRLLAGDDGYTAGIAVTAAGGVVLWIASAWLGGDLLESRGPELVEVLSKTGS